MAAGARFHPAELAKAVGLDVGDGRRRSGPAGVFLPRDIAVGSRR